MMKQPGASMGLAVMKVTYYSIRAFKPGTPTSEIEVMQIVLDVDEDGIVTNNGTVVGNDLSEWLAANFWGPTVNEAIATAIKHQSRALDSLSRDVAITASRLVSLRELASLHAEPESPTCH